MTTKQIIDGAAVVEDESLGLKVTVYPDGSGKIESTSPSRESRIFANVEKADALAEEARQFMFEHLNLGNLE